MSESNKKPLQIYLRQDQVNALRRVAEQRGESLAELVRQGVDMLLEGLPPDQDPLLEVLALYDSGIEDLTQKHDEYLVDLLQDESSP